MLRSLRARLLTASMAVAVVSVAATAWLTTRGSEERLRDSVERTLDTDGEIYGQLFAFANTQGDWDGVDELIAELSAETGRRIALTTPKGRMIADSARLQGREGVPLPEKPAALVDPLLPLGTWSSVEELSAEPAQFRPTPAEIAERERMAETAADCLLQHGYEPEVYYTEQELPTVQVAYPEGELDEEQMLAADAALEQCTDPGLYAPVAAELAVSEEVTQLEADCLDDAGVPYTIARDDGTSWVELAGESEHDIEIEGRCSEEAQREAMDPFMTDAANLYLGERNRAGITLADAGSSRTLVVAGAVVLLAFAVTVLTSRRVLRPVAALTAAAQRMESGDLTQRVDDRGRDELARLAHAFNGMVDALAGHEQQRRRLASDVAHELRTPLANLRGYVEAAQDGVTPTDPALLSSLHEEAVLLQRLVDDLQTLALAESGRLPLAVETVDVTELAAQVVGAFRLSAEAAGVALAAEGDDEVVVEADPVRLRQVLGNLVANALRHTPAGGTVTVRTAADEGAAVLAVADTGEGIAPDHLPHVFDRFWRADESRTRDTGGSGLGLAISRQLVELHGGTLTVESTLDEGTTFTLRLPLRP